MTPAIPSTRAGRQAAIREILASTHIASQEQLRSQLVDLGVDVTQATLSRDLMDMRATKIRTADGVLQYSVPDIDGVPTHDGEATQERLVRWCQSLLVTAIRIEHQLVIRTLVGGANLLGSALDSARFDEIVGTIAGDDTILVICRTPAEAQIVEHRLMKLADPSSSPTPAVAD
ncbi:arginine repressor [Schaalia sp. ZJ405]|uniref:arginine repressor n=1 Tax=unclassified Schaalia TaxID=2691889 RepID=UPI0013ECD235|nr:MULTISPECIES: arginine repressor [unclassified Schaalia]QPK82030.1 arginine repressor [Schaalia sp. ZJ405]